MTVRDHGLPCMYVEEHQTHFSLQTLCFICLALFVARNIFSLIAAQALAHLVGREPKRK